MGKKDHFAPLQEAVFHLDVNMAKILVSELGVNIDSTQTSGYNGGPWTSLHLAIKSNYLAMVDALLYLGADVSMGGKTGGKVFGNAMDLATQSGGDAEVLACLERHRKSGEEIYNKKRFSSRRSASFTCNTDSLLFK